MSQSLVRKNLLTALSAYAAAHNPPLKIIRQNDGGTKPTDQSTFLEPMLIPANTTVPNVAADRRRFMGTFQINIWTKSNIGAGPGEAIAEELCQLFSVMPKNQLPVSIESPGNIKTAFSDISEYYITPVLFSYRLEADN